MQPVPNYQIIEFLDWLKRNQRRIDIQSDELEHLAKTYLKDKNQIDDVFDLRFVLKIYQLCPQIDEETSLAEWNISLNVGDVFITFS